MSLVVGHTYRYGRPYGPYPATRDGLPNFFYETRADGSPSLLLDAGINTPAGVKHGKGLRTPVVLIRSSPNKASDESIPWHDHFDIDLGCVTYYGDNRFGRGRAEDAPGNSRLLAETTLHLSPYSADRNRAAPLLLFRTVRADGRIKGQVRFEGIAIIEGCEKTVQIDRAEASYDNYRFSLALVDLVQDGHKIDRRWLADRRDSKLNDEQANDHAPSVWRTWVQGAHIDDVRAIASLQRNNQTEVAAFGDEHAYILRRLEERYSESPVGFSSVAAGVVEFLFREAGHAYRTTRIDAPSGRFAGYLQTGVSAIGRELEIVGIVELQTLPTRLSARAVAAMFRDLVPGSLPIAVTRQPIPLRNHDQFHTLVVDGRRLAQVLHHLNQDRTEGLDDLLDALEADATGIVTAAVGGQSGYQPSSGV